jgi:Prokaryotic E2 family E
MALPDSDSTYLVDRGITHQIAVDAGMTCIVFPTWKLPAGYDRETADLLVRLPAGYPDVPPDMWWFEPAIRLADGRVIKATEATEQHLGRSWQRWSRHFESGQWKSGVDGLESFIALIRRELARCIAEPAQ